MLTSLYNNFKSFFIPASPVIYLSLFILSSFRVLYLIFHKKEFVLYKEIINFLSVFYLLCLFHIVTAKDINVYGTSNFVPFKEINRYRRLSPLYLKNVIGNVILFIPYGYLISKYLKTKNFLVNFYMVAFASLAIEFTQLSVGRVFDIDDIILNIVGGTIGYLSYILFRKIYYKLPSVIKRQWFLNLISIIIMVLFVSFIVGMHV